MTGNPSSKVRGIVGKTNMKMCFERRDEWKKEKRFMVLITSTPVDG